MKSLDDMVKDVVVDFVTNGILFTALDVSNKVKVAMPFARHREVRDVVRSLFGTDMETQGYAKTPIQVTLGNGSTAEAILYHPLLDSWDLDSKYDAQQRAQSTPAPVSTAAPVTTLPVTVTPQSSTGVMSATVSVKANPKPVIAPAPQARVLWDQLFGSQPSLFPRK